MVRGNSETALWEELAPIQGDLEALTHSQVSLHLFWDLFIRQTPHRFLVFSQLCYPSLALTEKSPSLFFHKMH